MDWIHCNTCFALPAEGRTALFITNCGHLFCDGCLKKATDKKCCMCGQVYSSTIPLSKEMKPDVQVYFQDPNELFKNGLKQIKLSQQASEFQKGHSKRLHTYHKRQLTKASEMMKQAKELERKYRQVSVECEALKHFVSSLGYKPSDIMQKVASSPMQYRQPSPNTSSHMSPSPARQHHPSASQMSLNRCKTGCSPQRRNGPSPGVTCNRLSIRTPPMNGKIGPVGSSPGYISPSGQANQSKISQMLSASRNSVPAAASPNPGHWTLRTPTLEGKRPIQVHPRGSR